MARQLDDLELYARLYIELELEVLAYSEFGPLNATDAQIAREAFESRWRTFDMTKQVDLGSSILALRKAFEAFKDAQHQFNYAARYRGAADDVLAGGDWRASFGLYEDRAIELLEATREVVRTGQNVIRQRGGAPDDPPTIALQTIVDDMSKSEQDLYHDRRFAHDKMYRAAQERLAMLDEQEKAQGEKPPSPPEPEEPVYEQPETLNFDVDVEMADYDNLEPAWHGKVLLGSGSYGNAYLWLQTDTHGRIRQRVVQKTCDLRSTWYKDIWWTHGAPGSLGRYRTTLPNEIQANLSLRCRPGSSSIVELRNYNLRLDDRAADLYLEFCPFGDAYGLLKRGYNSADHGSRDKCAWEDHRSECKFLPEPFCWAVFRSLALAASLMGRGTIAPPHPLQADELDPPEDWNVIVHRDLKLENVFLGMPDERAFPGYPAVKVGDFGGAVVIPKNDSRPAEELITLKTTDHAAPEMDCALKRERRGKEVVVRQSSKTNVWGIGIIMYSLLSGKHGPTHHADSSYPTGYFNWKDPSRREPPPFDQSTRLFYSSVLLDLVLACLRYDDRDRPPVEYLVREIIKYTNPNGHAEEGQEGHDLAKGMKTLGPGMEGYEEMYGREYALDFSDGDQWAVGFAFEQVPWVESRWEERAPEVLKELMV